MLARACGKTNVHSLEPEDLAALTMEASAMAQVPLAGTDYTVGVDELSQDRMSGAGAMAGKSSKNGKGGKKPKVKSDVDKFSRTPPGSIPRARRRSASTSAIATTSICCPTTSG